MYECVFFYIKCIIEAYQVHLKASHEIYHQQQKMAIHIFAIMYTLQFII